MLKLRVKSEERNAKRELLKAINQQKEASLQAELEFEQNSTISKSRLSLDLKRMQIEVKQQERLKKVELLKAN